MRVTQSMLSNNLLRNLSTSYGKMAKLQEMIQTGKKITRPSDDPVVAVKGMSYRIDLDRVDQYKRNISDAKKWLDTSDEALGQVNEALKRVQELTVQAANDSNTPEDREKIKAEISQLRLQIQDIANTKVGDNYIFSGTHTDKPLFVNGAANPDITTGGNKSVAYNVFEGISIEVNTPGKDLFAQVDSYMSQLETALSNATSGKEIGDLLGDSGNSGLSGVYELVLSAQATVGAKQNRLELMENRIDIQKINVTKQLSENEDADYAESITEMVTAESIHQASLSVGAKIIQQTLVDFIR